MQPMVTTRRKQPHKCWSASAHGGSADTVSNTSPLRVVFSRTQIVVAVVVVLLSLLLSPFSQRGRGENCCVARIVSRPPTRRTRCYCWCSSSSSSSCCCCCRSLTTPRTCRIHVFWWGRAPGHQAVAAVATVAVLLPKLVAATAVSSSAPQAPVVDQRRRP